MSNKRTVAIWLALGAVSMSACVAEPVVENIEVVEAPLEPADRDPRSNRPRPEPPGSRTPRTVHCIPEPDKEYVARDPNVCAAIRFYCPVGRPFFDDCGCGCDLDSSDD
jgi:hypothetical protein